MYYLNKAVWFFLNPLMAALLGAAAGAVLLAFGGGRRRAWGGVVFVGAFVFLWFASTLAGVAALGLPLERPYLAYEQVEALPEADAIVVLGGGVTKVPARVYPDLFEGADRVWHAARLYRAGKAPLVVVSGSNDLVSAVPLLLDLGVGREAIEVDDESRNTYENSRFTERLLAGTGKGKRVLLVTSAWHLPRALGNFSKTGLEVVPAPCDFSAHVAVAGAAHGWDYLTPSADSLARFSYLAKEWMGKLARK